MRRFDNKGMMLIPAPIEEENIKEGNVLVATALYCPNGHSLINRRAMFNNYPGIVLQIRHDKDKGIMALSPIYGEKSHICLDIELSDGATIQMFCPECGVKLPVHSPCDACDADLIALFLTPAGNFNDCIAVCNRVGCPKANIITSGELIAVSRLDLS